MSLQPDPDAVLMLRVKRGDRAAFTGLVQKYKQPVLNFVHRSLRDEAEAEDVAQNVFLQVYKSRARYERTAKFSTWLFTIARNLCLNEIRRRSRHPAESLRKPIRKRRPAVTAVRGQKDCPANRKCPVRRTCRQNPGGAGQAARSPAHCHFALPAGRAKLRGNRQSVGLFAFRHEVTHSSRPRNT